MGRKGSCVGPSLDEKAEAFANAVFLRQQEMAGLLMEATHAWAAHFEETDPDSVEISGADLLGCLRNGVYVLARCSTWR